MEKDLMRTNCYDVDDTLIIVVSCLKNMQPNAYKELLKISSNVYNLCLEDTHINMAITKISGIICRNKIKKIVYAIVDKSPHCIQLHYINNEINKMMSDYINKIEVEHYVAVNDKLINISEDTIKKSKCLYDLECCK